MSIETSKQSLRDHIRMGWRETTVAPSVAQEGGFALPLPFSVPCPGGGQFRTMYYWDTYFTNRGLILDGEMAQARNNAENLMHTVEQLGFIPNSMKPGINRTQPPVASHLYREVYERTQDKAWLRRALAATEREYAFWYTCQQGPDGLFHTRPQCPPAELWNFYWQVRDRVPGMPADPVDQLEFLRHQMAEAAMGCDFTSRYAGRAGDFYPVLVNTLIYMMLCDAAWFSSELGDDGGRVRWLGRAEDLQRRIQDLLWNESRGIFLDYDFVTRESTSIAHAETFVPLWAGLANLEQSARVRENLPLFEQAHGVAACEDLPHDRICQWDYPNAWPPITEFVFRGLARNGYLDDARRVALKYTTALEGHFASTGQLWEKYNAVTGELDVVDEYKMPPFIGWTAGVYLSARDLLNKA